MNMAVFKSERPVCWIMPSTWADPASIARTFPETRRFGFSGSRARFSPGDKEMIVTIVNSLPAGSVVISGGCKSKETDPVTGVVAINENTDRWSVDRARERGLFTIEHSPVYPELDKIRSTSPGKNVYWYITKENYRRNQLVVDDSEMLIALINDEKGGTWDTVKRALKKGIPVVANYREKKSWESVDRARSK
jgi:hypothetical protein